MNSKRTQVDVVVLVPLEVERKAVTGYLHQVKYEQMELQNCFTGRFEGLHHTYLVRVIQTGPQNTVVALAAEKAVGCFKPSLLLLTGIAGGTKDVVPGDLVVARKAYNLDLGKETPTGFAARPEPHPYSREMLGVAQQVADAGQWMQRLPFAMRDVSIRVYQGAIASSDKVIASTDSELYKRIKRHYEDTLAVEMESAGFASAAMRHPELRYANVRCISDVIDDKARIDKTGFQEVASARAATFLLEMLYQMDCSTFITPSMDVKKIAKDVCELLFPNAFKEMGKVFADGISVDIQTLWNRIKYIFSEADFEDLSKDPDDTAAKGAIEMKLRKALEGNADLLQAVIGLLHAAIAAKPKVGSSTLIENSKNVIHDSNIRVGGNFHLGDTNYNNT